MSFKEWVIRLKNRDTPTGDLARDIMSDKDFPEDSDREKILHYMYSRNACSEAISTFKSAWKSYQAYVRKHQ